MPLAVSASALLRCDFSQSRSTGKLPSLDRGNHVSLGKQLGAARDRLRNMWNFGKSNQAASPPSSAPSALPFSAKQKGSPVEVEQDRLSVEAVQRRAAETLALEQDLDMIAQKVFRSHLTGRSDQLAFAKLPAALQSLLAECSEFQLSNDIVEQLHRTFGHNQNGHMSFAAFLALFKQGLPSRSRLGRTPQYWTDGPKRASTAPGLSSINLDDEFPGSPTSPGGRPNSVPVDSCASARTRVSGGSRLERLPPSRKMRHFIIKLLRHAEFEGIAGTIFQEFNPDSNCRPARAANLQIALKTSSMAHVEDVIRDVAAFGDHGRNFVCFLELLREELRNYALQSKDGCPLNFREFVALAR